ncbi:hypothetical protein GF357_02325 [Candidatus Dojkabacteria bacterium]|nr:hypothetical protein [Candidatus Dojkabacteria bacterium]
MTYLIINRDHEVRKEELLQQLNRHLELEIETTQDLIKYPDIHVIETTEKTKAMGIDQVKKLQLEMLFKPLNLSKQAGVIAEAQNLTKEAQNALLKTLEEQPENTIYLLTVNNEKNLLPTIVSRCVKLYVKKTQNTDGKVEKNYDKTDKPEFLEKDIAAQFEFMKKLTEAEKEVGGKILDFMIQLGDYYRAEWKSSVNSNPQEARVFSRKIEIIETAQKRLQANTNRLFTLENLVLQLSKTR